ncbi:methionyl-tRNA formyltransferase [Formicincola oecophyllae]|uniref:Methionyl-tRNA formyltransferase n=1 Tax=Formicincola oecophyllae TaxID=2558361 RepID=A0A4Y6U8W5_9PROT|nr:methionyl-tRNA formyltransferase [Formicincola oecophyllae]QDH13899.1 methionyl-tRNA formyltransferase [Formicincola oecophyllae]
MKLVFMGSPDFAVPALEALVGAGHEVAAVYSQPPRPAGRGNKLRRQPVHVAAEKLGITVRTPLKLRANQAELEHLQALQPDAIVVAAYGLLLPAEILRLPKRGCLNIHASLLPRWRGASPIQSAILHSDPQSGVTIMQMDEGLDTGPMLASATTPITGQDTAATLHNRLAALGAPLLLDVLTNPPQPQAQPAAGVTHAPKISRDDGALDWNRPAPELDCQIRAYTPWPGCFTRLLDKIGTPLFTLRVGAAQVAAHHPTLAPGQLKAAGGQLLVGCGAGSALALTKLQKPGRAMMATDDFLRGHPLEPGQKLG